MEDFKDCLDSLGVDDIRGVGPLFTWWNCQTARPIHRKLDRALGNDSWFSNFSLAQANYGPRGLSDHSPVMLQLGTQSSFLKKPFQFFNHLLKVEGFRDCVFTAWNQNNQGNPFTVFTDKLKRTKKALISLNRTLGNLFSSVKLATEDLHHIQSLLQANPLDPALITQEQRAIQTLWTALDMEEILMQQKSRANWLQLGDRNSRFFFNSVKNRWNRNKILSIHDANGELVQGQQAVESVAVDYFVDLFNPTPCSVNSEAAAAEQEDLNVLSSKHINSYQAASLILPISDEEIYKVLKSMPRNKSPGPDGFNVDFFIHCWDIVGEDFSKAVKFFFAKCRMPKGIN